MARHKLSAVQVKNLDKGKYEDGEGLRLVKAYKEKGKWVFRFKRQGRSREMGLGPWPAVSLSEARKAADRARSTLAANRDPIAERDRLRRQEGKVGQSLNEVTNDCFEARKAELKDDGSAGRWLSPLKIHVLPKIGKVPVREIDAPMLRDVLSPIWHSKADTARKALNRMNIVIKHAAALGLDVDMQAVEKAKALLGQTRHETKRIPSMPWQEVPAFYQSLTDLTSCHLALRFLILTIGARSKPVRLLTLDQIEDDLWIVPAEMMKGRKGKAQDFRIPLSSEASSVIESAKILARGDLLFPGSKPGQPISDMTMNKYMKDKGLEARPHGFRSSFREWADHSGYRPEVAETALAHSIGSEVARAYLRTDYLEERREMMERWGGFVGSKP
jgi:integrase